jgi:hypothetical protein
VITGSRGGMEPGDAAVIETGERDRQLSNPVKRITGASAIAQCLLLHTAARVVDPGVGQLVDSEPAYDLRRRPKAFQLSHALSNCMAKISLFFRAAALLSVLLTTLVGAVSWPLTRRFAVHFCKWPATISCEQGVPVLWWLFLVAVAVVWLGSTFASGRLLFKTDLTTVRYAVGFLIWATLFPAIVALPSGPRMLTFGDLLLDGAWLGSGLMLSVSVFVRSVNAGQWVRQLAFAVIVVSWLGGIWLLPGIFEHAWSHA